jgi:hypothetical protein
VSRLPRQAPVADRLEIIATQLSRHRAALVTCATALRAPDADYRASNAADVVEHYLVRRIDEVLDELSELIEEVGVSPRRCNTSA